VESGSANFEAPARQGALRGVRLGILILSPGARFLDRAKGQEEGREGKGGPGVDLGGGGRNLAGVRIPAHGFGYQRRPGVRSSLPRRTHARMSQKSAGS
jgi:hypothetical protein